MSLYSSPEFLAYQRRLVIPESRSVPHHLVRGRYFVDVTPSGPVSTAPGAARRRRRAGIEAARRRSAAAAHRVARFDRPPVVFVAFATGAASR